MPSNQNFAIHFKGTVAWPPKQQGLSRCFEKGDDVIVSSPSGEAFCLLAVGGCGEKLH